MSFTRRRMPEITHRLQCVWQDFSIFRNIEFHNNPYGGSRIVSGGQTDRQTWRKFSNILDNAQYYIELNIYKTRVISFYRKMYEINYNNQIRLHDMCKGKGKAVPLQAWSGPQGSRKLRFPNFVTTAQDVGKVVSLTHRPPLPPGNTPGTQFC